ncbi:MAG: type VI secretion system protein TssA [Sedimentisphaerales bacterium]|nr:type VI secretion system protein TssA [Sedimentisphaerales bacterium]
MSVIDIEALLGEISPEAPCGDDLAYDPSYLALEGMLQTGSGAGMIEAGDTVVEEPNWRDMRQRCLDLLSRTKDLRVLQYLNLALIKTEGMAGLRDGLALMHGILEKYWDHVHPQLDPEDNNDPLERMNIMANLSPPPGSYQDPMRFKQRLSEAPLCNSPRMGRFGLRDILIANGTMTVPADDESAKADMAAIDAGFEDTDIEELQTTGQLVNECVDFMKKIDDLITQYVGVGQSPNFDGFRGVLGDIQKHVQGYLSKRGYGAEPAEGGAEAAVQAAGGSGQPISGQIRSTQDVKMMLEKICSYYEQNEPSSPVPLLLRRAQRLVSKNFMDIVKDIAPDAMGQIKNISGIDSSDEGG